MKKFQAFLAAILMIAGLGLLAPAAAQAAPYCGITWGSLPKSNSHMTQAPITNVRAGTHECYDRLVVDINGKGAGYAVRYVDQVLQDGSGLPVALRGAAYLQVVVRAPAYNDRYQETYNINRSELVNVTGFPTFRQVAGAGSFEGVTTIGLGVRARLPFRVFTLDGPGGGSRLVIDVAHRW